MDTLDGNYIEGRSPACLSVKNEMSAGHGVSLGRFSILEERNKNNVNDKRMSGPCVDVGKIKQRDMSNIQRHLTVQRRTRREVYCRWQQRVVAVMVTSTMGKEIE